MTYVHYSEMTDRYKGSLEKDAVIYEVLRYLAEDYTIIEPGTVGREYYRTKGHIHKDGSPELYRCIGGKGLLVEVGDGMRVRPLYPGAEYYIRGDAFHFVTNTGAGRLVFATQQSRIPEKDYTITDYIDRIRLIYQLERTAI